MPLVRSYQDIPQPRVQSDVAGGHFAWRTDFLKAPAVRAEDSPVAFLAEGSAGRVLDTHFHQVDQFQVVYVGDGILGGHALKFGGVHFNRAYTPYGPIHYGEKGLGFLTLRAHRDDGRAWFIREHRETLEKVPNRTPWQVTVMPDFSIQPGPSGVAVKAIEGLEDDRGLAGYSMVLKPGVKAFAPDPSRGEGQYVLVLKGGIEHEGQLKQGLSVIWVAKDEPPCPLQAGPEGCEVLVLNFPIPGGGVPPAKKPASSDELKSYQCVLCAFIYDEAAGMPDHGIAPGTRWADVPEDFGCPDCDAKKADFEMLEF